MPRALSASELLHVWERGDGRPSLEQGLLLLSVACPGVAPGDLARMPVGRRDAVLMELRHRTFGSALNGLAVCPSCGERVEVGFPLEALFAQHQMAPDLSLDPGQAETHKMSTSGYELAFRLPTSADLLPLAANSRPDPQAARQTLLEGCLLAAEHQGQPVPAADLPAEVVEALVARMEELDPLADVILPLTCPACGNAWEVAFDIVSFFWAEINAWGERLVREVHTLASAYGWREADILAMTARRRQKYLELAGA
jgi:hypothetical protein